MQKLLVPGHHSLADWDFQQGATYRSLSTSFAVSPPTSLQLLKSTAGTVYDNILCRLEATQNLPQGELRTWFRRNYIATGLFTFRNQAPLDTANHTNGYVVAFSDWTNMKLRRYVDGGMTEVGWWANLTETDQHRHWRIVWWNGENLSGQPALAVRLYKEVAGEWVLQGLTQYDTANQFKDSEINRCGLYIPLGQNTQVFIDDTEIWKPAENGE